MSEDPVLDVRDLRMRFGGVAAVDGVTMVIHPGEVLAVIGQNGSGKTTLINAITGIYRPTGGSVRLCGADITGRPISAIARLGVARTFQNLRLFEELTAMENVLAGLLGRTRIGLWDGIWPGGRSAARTRDRARQALELMDVGHSGRMRVADLAHGDRRRVEIARALVAEPALLILDEPSAGLAHDEAGELVAALAGLRRASGAMLLIEHNLSVVERLADRVLVMHSGMPIASGGFSDVLAEPAVRSLYMGFADV